MKLCECTEQLERELNPGITAFVAIRESPNSWIEDEGKLTGFSAGIPTPLQFIYVKL